MKEIIREKLALPEEVQKYLIGTFYDISIDDGGGHKIEILDEWMEDRLAEAGFIEKTTVDKYPKEAYEHMVLSREEAINLDNIAASYAETLQTIDPMRANSTLSTVDAFYTDENNRSYFIEFKNGDWKEKEIKGKVFESRALLDDITVLDKYAIITSNREKVKKEIKNLNLSEKLKVYCGLDDNANFYKKQVQLLVVYSNGSNIVREYVRLCQKRDKYDWIEQKLLDENFKALRQKEVQANKVQFGHEMINRLAMLLITANSVNQNFEYYLKIMTMLERMEKLEQNSKEIKKLCEQLNQYPKLVKVLYVKMYGNNKATEQVNAWKLLEMAIKVSAHKSKKLELEQGDDYNIIKEIAKHTQTNKEKSFSEIMIELYKEIGDVLPEFEVQKNVICDENFTNLKMLLEQERHEEFLKRNCFIYQIMHVTKMEETEKDIKVEMLKNICGMDEMLAEKIARLTANKEKLFMRIVILWNYLYKDRSIRNDIREDSYIHITRQMKYLNELQQHGSAGIQKYGVFAEKIKDKVRYLTGEEKKKRMMSEAEKIKSDIVKGKAIYEIMPLQKIVDITISQEEKEIRKLQAGLKGTVLLDVCGCKAVDFTEALLQ